jgi:hypothetical protein
VSHIHVKPEIGTGLTFEPTLGNASHAGNALPDSLLISFRLPPDTPEDPLSVGSSHKATEEAERPPKKIFSYVFQVVVHFSKNIFSKNSKNSNQFFKHFRKISKFFEKIEKKFTTQFVLFDHFFWFKTSIIA